MAAGQAKDFRRCFSHTYLAARRVVDQRLCLGKAKLPEPFLVKDVEERRAVHAGVGNFHQRRDRSHNQGKGQYTGCAPQVIEKLQAKSPCPRDDVKLIEENDQTSIRTAKVMENLDEIQVAQRRMASSDNPRPLQGPRQHRIEAFGALFRQGQHIHSRYEQVRPARDRVLQVTEQRGLTETPLPDDR